jgi:hypothetical protein
MEAIQVLFPILPCFLPHSQSPIENIPNTAQMLGQENFLFSIRVEPILKSFEHGFNSV